MSLLFFYAKLLLKTFFSQVQLLVHQWVKMNGNLTIEGMWPVSYTGNTTSWNSASVLPPLLDVGNFGRSFTIAHTVENENVGSVTLLLCKPLGTWGMGLLQATRMRSRSGPQGSRTGLQLSRLTETWWHSHHGYHGDERSGVTCMICFSISSNRTLLLVHITLYNILN